MSTQCNKSRISRDVAAKAGAMAQSLGFAGARQALEAVFRVYADDYLKGFEQSARDRYLASTLFKQQVNAMLADGQSMLSIAGYLQCRISDVQNVIVEVERDTKS